MAVAKRKQQAPGPIFQRDPGPWNGLILSWLATLA